MVEPAVESRCAERARLRGGERAVEERQRRPIEHTTRGIENCRNRPDPPGRGLGALIRRPGVLRPEQERCEGAGHVREPESRVAGGRSSSSRAMVGRTSSSSAVRSISSARSSISSASMAAAVARNAARCARITSASNRPSRPSSETKPAALAAAGS